MSNIKIFRFLFLLIGSFTLAFTTGCVKDEFDEPPLNGEDPTISGDQIVSLEAVFDKFSPGAFTKIDLDKYVQAIVIADDASGSFYKTLVLQDENSERGITILIDDNNLSAVYPIGRRVYVLLKDLWISDYNGLPQIGYGPFDDDGDQRMSSIPGVLAPNIVVPGKFGLAVIPTEVQDITLLGGNLLNRLVIIRDLQFTSGSIGKTYADAINQISVNHELEDCRKNKLTLRASGFASFAGEAIPEGKGDITAIYGIFGNTRQLTIRNTPDVKFTEERCGSGNVSGSRVNIADVRKLYAGSPVFVTDGFIEGTVITDYTTANVTGRNLAVQDETGGIVVRFTENHNFGVGQKIKVGVKDIEVSEFNGLLQLNNVTLGLASTLGVGTITPKEVTIKQVLDDFDTYESTLVMFSEVTFSGSDTYDSNLKFSDGTGTLALFTRSQASFAGASAPETAKTLVGVVGEFSSNSFNPQLQIRNLEDVDGEGGGGGPVTGERINIADARKLFSGTAVNAPAGFIEGVVISEYQSANITGRNLILQDETGGIAVRFDANHTFDLGKKIKIEVKGVEISEFNGLLQFNNVPLTSASEIGNGSITPKQVTIKELLDAYESYESTLVTIVNPTFSGSTTLNADLKVEDNTGTISLFTRSQASFFDSNVPSNVVSVTAYVGEFSNNGFNPQLQIRNLQDIK